MRQSRGSSSSALTEKLLERHSKIITTLARRYRALHPTVWTEEDARQHAVIGALDAYRTFQPDRGAALSTWVFTRVRSELQRSVNASGLVRIPQLKSLLLHYAAGNLTSHPRLLKVAEERFGAVGTAAYEQSLSEHTSLMQQPSLADEETLARATIQEDTVDLLMLNLAMGKLDDATRELLVRKASGESLQEIASSEGLAATQIKTQLYVARRRLRMLCSEA